MAELAVGLVGAAATIGAGTLAAGSGFTGRHESSLREEMTEMKRSTRDFMENLQSGEVTRDEESDFLKTRDEAIRRQNEYHERLEDYKETSWFNLPRKLKKKKNVRQAKRLTRHSNHSLRSLNEAAKQSTQSMHSGSDTSSICASAGSPPGSNLAVDDLRDWIDDVDSGFDHHSVDISWSRKSLDSQRMEQRSRRPNLPLRRSLSLPAQLGGLPTVFLMKADASFTDEPASFTDELMSLLSPLIIGTPEKTHKPSRRTLRRRSSSHVVRSYLSMARRTTSAVPPRARSPWEPPQAVPLLWEPPQEFGRHPSTTLPVQRTPPPSYRLALRQGMWNRRGDHLTMDGFIVYAPRDCAYPEELSDYPAETMGYRDHMGTEIPYLASRPELLESLPRHGMPPLQPYEKFVVYEYMQ